MATKVLTDATIWLGALDLTSYTNDVNVTETAQAKDATTFGSGGYTELRGGLKDVTASVKGFVDYANPDAAMNSNLGVAGQILSCTDGGTAGCRAIFTQQMSGQYQHLGQVGEMNPFDLSLMGSTSIAAVAGVCLHPKTTVTGNSNGSTYDTATGIASGYAAYAAIHCFTAGTTADIIIESDDNTDFSSATTRFTNTITATGGTWCTPVPATVTDRYFRVRTANVTGTFSVAVLFGIRAV